MTARSHSDEYRLLYVGPDAGAGAEHEAALTWLRGLPDVAVTAVPLSDLVEAIREGQGIVWFHWEKPPKLTAAARLALDEHVRAGGGLLATLAAATLPVELRWEDVPPNEATDAAWSDEPDDLALAESFSVPPRLRGLQSFRGHPLFEGLGSGTYTWAPAEGERFVRYAYSGESWPSRARVVAVEKSYIAMNPDRRLAWEYLVGDGLALCIGGFIYFAAPDARRRPHLEWLMRNALERVAPDAGRARLMGGSWRPARSGVKLDGDVPLPPKLPQTAGGVLQSGDDLRLERAASDAPFTLAGSRALLVGRERSGPEEIWFHPLRAVSRWELTAAAEHYLITPDLIIRRLRVADSLIEERVAVAAEIPAVLIELSPEPQDTGPGGTTDPTSVLLTLETDMRLMWPYPAAASGRLSYALQAGAVGVETEGGEWLGVRIEPAPAVLTVANISQTDRSRLRIQAELELAEPIRILLLGAGRDERPPVALDLDTWAERRRAQRQERLRQQSRLHGGHPEWEEAVGWATWRLLTYRVRVPELGTSLVAGYGGSKSDPFFDGRPGYAWYFGRDACWTALASLAVGQYEVVREVLEFLGRHQDITGKILHECTTSGVVHYDAADSTPLYLLLAARYLESTGDEETLRREWPRILKAYEFCLTTDGDGDGLIENSGVGHGWVEFGPFGDHHVSLYLAGVWVAALQELETSARRLGELELADELAYRAAAARSSLELSFYDPIEGRYANGRRPDGSLDMADTVMTAVPLLLGAVRGERCQSFLDRVAGEDFTVPWGVRMVPRSHPEYRPDGYHTGSAWPLFTGWVSLAERAAGRTQAAERHWRQVASLFRVGALGAWPEVLHGDDLTVIGLTPDQAWSTAMAILPIAEDRRRRARSRA